LPINCVLMGEQLFSDEKKGYEADPTKKAGWVQQLSTKPPSFTVTTSKKGYD
jgi:hypothetical protein